MADNRTPKLQHSFDSNHRGGLRASRWRATARLALAGLVLAPWLAVVSNPAEPGQQVKAGQPAPAAADVHFNPGRGYYFSSVDVHLTTDIPGGTLGYTTDGNVPTAPGRLSPANHVVVRLTNTTVLRAAVLRNGSKPSKVETHTYIFPATVADQTRPTSIPKTWPGGERADFEMDPRVIAQALPGYSLTNALLDIPSLSIVMAPADLFGSRNGIYSRSLSGNERAGSFEILPFAGTNGVQANAGISLRGLSSIKKSLTPKHSFTVVFRERYGATKLPFPVFPDTAVQKFNALVLRGNVLDSWANSEVDWNHPIDGELRWYRARASYVRDQWMRDAQHSLGQPAAYGRFVHLYLNGYYWGVYNLIERLDEKFAAQHLGGKASDYDVVADSELKGGNLEAWTQLQKLAKAELSSHEHYQRLLGNQADGTRNPAYPVLLDVTNLVDYMILHIYAGADDWPWHNWVALRRRTPDSTGFKFLAWDQELSINSLVKQHTDTGQGYAEVDRAHAEVYARCRANAEFRQLFADRVQRHLFNQGALSVSNNIARYARRVRELDKALVAESARWGDFYRPAQPYLREVEWLSTNQWMREVFFPSNHFIALKRFRDAKLFPSLRAPVFNQFGGAMPAGFKLTIANPQSAGLIYLTTTGVDPRSPGGGIAPAAQIYREPFGLRVPTLVRARVRHEQDWSPLVEATFSR